MSFGEEGHGSPFVDAACLWLNIRKIIDAELEICFDLRPYIDISTAGIYVGCVGVSSCDCFIYPWNIVPDLFCFEMEMPSQYPCLCRDYFSSGSVNIGCKR